MFEKWMITGTLAAPNALLWIRWPPSVDNPLPFMRYRGSDGKWVDDDVADAMGRWALSGDLLLTEIPKDAVGSVTRLLSVDVPADEPDPIDSGLAAVRYEGVYGRRPGPSDRQAEAD